MARAAAALGMTKFRLTGGEPLVRRNRRRTGRGCWPRSHRLRDLAMTTNGTLLARYARPLAAAGLQRVNVSLDAMDPARYAAITRGGDVRQVLAGIDAAQAAGLAPVRLNCVVESGSSEPDARDVARWAAAAGLEVRFIRRMDLAGGTFAVVEGGHGRRLPPLQPPAADQRRRRPAVPVLQPGLPRPRAGSRPRPWPGPLSFKPRAGSACTNLAMHAIGG